MLKRDIQAPTQPRALLEQTAHAHRRLRRPIRTRRVGQHDREPPFPRRIGLGITQHRDRLANRAVHDRDRRQTVTEFFAGRVLVRGMLRTKDVVLDA